MRQETRPRLPTSFHAATPKAAFLEMRLHDPVDPVDRSIQSIWSICAICDPGDPMIRSIRRAG
jgi:hypothetical protein